MDQNLLSGIPSNYFDGKGKRVASRVFTISVTDKVFLRLLPSKVCLAEKLPSKNFPWSPLPTNS